MAFNELHFLFLFFPVVLLLHKLIPGMLGKNIVLLVCSLLDCHFFNLGPVLLYSMGLAFAENCIE